MIARALFALGLVWGVGLVGLAVWDATAAGESPASSLSGGLLFLVVLPFIAPPLLRRVSLWVVGSRPPAASPRGRFVR
jgi:hypothetical protein